MSEQYQKVSNKSYIDDYFLTHHRPGLIGTVLLSSDIHSCKYRSRATRWVLLGTVMVVQVEHLVSQQEWFVPHIVTCCESCHLRLTMCCLLLGYRNELLFIR